MIPQAKRPNHQPMTLLDLPRKRPLLTYALSLLGGCLSAFSMAPASFWPVLFITVPVLYLALSGADKGKQSFLIGWLFGFGYFLCSLSWISSALLVEGNGYRWAWPLAVSGIPFLLAFYWGLAALLWHKTSPWPPFIRWISFALIFGGMEILRGYAFTGFPWNLFAYTWVNTLEMIQISALITAYGLTILTWLWVSLGALFWSQGSSKFCACMLVALTIGLNLTYGHNRLKQETAYKPPPVNIKTVAGHIPQNERWIPDKIFAHFTHYIRLSENHDPNLQRPTLIIWPETAMLDWYYTDPGLSGYVQDMLHSYPNGAVLISGALRNAEEGKTYNSIIMMDKTGAISNIYSKTHLVPFGEYIPFQNLIPLDPVNQFSGFVKGNGPATYETPFAVSYAPAVCYEIIFPHSLIAAGQETPDFIINVTNDAWYEGSAGPAQHQAQVVFRAIEYKIPIIRVANMGATGVISPYGRMHP